LKPSLTSDLQGDPVRSGCKKREKTEKDKLVLTDGKGEKNTLKMGSCREGKRKLKRFGSQDLDPSPTSNAETTHPKVPKSRWKLIGKVERRRLD